MLFGDELPCETLLLRPMADSFTTPDPNATGDDDWLLVTALPE